MKLKEDEVIKGIKPKEVLNPRRTVFSYFGFDSRKIKDSSLFFAIKGERDGHDFIRDAFSKGAKGAVVERKIGGIPLFIVGNTLKALGDLASFSLSLNSTERIGITGSAGKTTTKEFINYFLSQRFSAERTPGNWNNLIGVPTFLLNRSKGSKYLIIEMGISEKGEMGRLVEITSPTTAMITRIYEAHTEFLNSIEEVRKEKNRIFLRARRAAFNLDDKMQEKLWRDFQGEKRFYSAFKKADVRLLRWNRISPLELSVEISYLGKKLNGRFHFWSSVFLENLLGSLALSSFFLKEPPEFDNLRPLEGRGKAWEKGRITFIDESYNSNPSSLLRSLTCLSSLEGKKIAVISDMLELKEPEKEHKQIGKAVSGLEIDLIIFAGELMKFAAAEAGRKREGILWAESPESAGKILEKKIISNSIVFFKGSHATELWKEVERWK